MKARSEQEMNIQQLKVDALKNRILSLVEKKNPMDETGHSDTMDAFHRLIQIGEAGIGDFRDFTVDLMSSMLRHPEIAQEYSKASSYVELDKYFECLFHLFDTLEKSETFNLLMDVKRLEDDGFVPEVFKNIEDRINRLTQQEKEAA